MSECRWSGWPGAWCLDCGREDPREVALVEGKVDDEGLVDMTGIDLNCSESGSNRHNPYVEKKLND